MRRGEKTEKSVKVFLAGLLVVALFSSFVSAAGVGLKWDKESIVVPEHQKACITYYVYNPWTTDSYAQMRLSDEMQPIVLSYDTESKLIPAETSSREAIPIEFCFKTPYLYERDCWIGDSLFCKEECNEDMMIYSGEVEAVEISESQFNSGGTGGSATQMSVSAPVKVGVQCIAHGRNLSLIYIAVILLAGILLTLNIINRRKAKKGGKSKKH